MYDMAANSTTASSPEMAGLARPANITVMAKKKPKPTGDVDPQGAAPRDKRVTVEMESALWDAFERYMGSLDVKPKKSEVIRVAVAAFLKEKKFWPPAPPAK